MNEAHTVDYQRMWSWASANMSWCFSFNRKSFYWKSESVCRSSHCRLWCPLAACALLRSCCLSLFLHLHLYLSFRWSICWWNLPPSAGHISTAHPQPLEEAAKCHWRPFHTDVSHFCTRHDCVPSSSNEFFQTSGLESKLRLLNVQWAQFSRLVDWGYCFLICKFAFELDTKRLLYH